MLGGCNVLAPQARPVYPEEAKEKRIQGTVKLRAVIARTGELRNIEVLEGDPLLVPAALTAVRQWRYAPCLMNSEPLEVVTPIDVNFNLNQ
jgi:protein TonB